MCFAAQFLFWMGIFNTVMSARSFVDCDIYHYSATLVFVIYYHIFSLPLKGFFSPKLIFVIIYSP